MEDNTTNIFAELIPEKNKEDEKYIQRKTDQIISALVYDKDHLRKAYNYYNGVMDKDQYRYIEENYGIGSPTSVQFIPLIRRHVDALVGRHLQTKVKPKVTCKDSKTLTNIFREKQLKINEEVHKRYMDQLNNNLMYAFMDESEKKNKQPPVDKATELEIQKLRDDIDKNFISEYELSVQNVLTFIDQNKHVDLYNKKKILYLDLLIAGQCYYRTTLKRKGETPEIEILNPMDVFYEKNANSPYVKNSTRAVVRKYMNKQQIITKYGHLLSKEELEKLDSRLETTTDYNSNIVYVRTSEGSLVSNLGVTTVDSLQDSDKTNLFNNYYAVYEVEWISNNKYKNDKGEDCFRADRYEAVRIGNDIYIELGKSENTIRSAEHPDECCLSINGIAYSDRNGAPYSLVLATASLQDKYNLLFYYRDALIASSGIKGDFLDVSRLPEWLGKTPQERILKYHAYKKKVGIALIDTNQPGDGQLNTIYHGYDDTVDGNAINAIQQAIMQIEETCSSITGVYREQLGGIEQRDAVTNVQVGINQSTIVTKQYHQMMDNITTEILIDMVNMCKIAYSEGMIGSVILGDKLQKVFSIDPLYFSFTDYDIHIADSGDIIQQMTEIKQISYELIKSGQVDIDVVFEAITAESLGEMKSDILKAYKKRREENNQLEQATQAVQQYENQIKQLQDELNKTKNDFDQYKAKEIELKATKIQRDYEIAKEANSIKSSTDSKKMENDAKKVELEMAQLFDQNPYNNKIKD